MRKSKIALCFPIIGLAIMVYALYQAVYLDHGDLLTYSLVFFGGGLAGMYTGAVVIIEELHMKIYGKDKPVDVDAVLDDLF